jgi:NMD protein affecting ribosome stability and mRNA decay
MPESPDIAACRHCAGELFRIERAPDGSTLFRCEQCGELAPAPRPATASGAADDRSEATGPPRSGRHRRADGT